MVAAVADHPVPRPAALRLAAAAATLAVGVHLWGLYRVQGPHSPGWFPELDKAEHLLGFAAPVCCVLVALTWFRRARPWYRGARRRSPRILPQLLVVAAFAVHAVLSELIQHWFYLTRTGDPRDALADLAGTGLGAAVAWLVLRRRPGRAR